MVMPHWAEPRVLGLTRSLLPFIYSSKLCLQQKVSSQSYPHPSALSQDREVGDALQKMR